MSSSNIVTLQDITSEYSTKPIHNITNCSYVQLFSRKALKEVHRIVKTIEKETGDVIKCLATRVRGQGNVSRYENSINYSLCRSIPGQLGYGRYVGTKGSLETLERCVRGSLCHSYYDDIDVVNCHPTIIPQMAKRWYNLKMPHLSKYVANREHYFTIMRDKFNYTDDMTKEIIISILYGGHCPSTVKLSNNYEEEMPQDFHEIKKEMIQFTTKLIKDKAHSALYNYLSRQNKKNLGGSYTSWIVQTEERKILESLVYCLTTNGFPVDVLAYDGCQIRKCDDNIITNDIIQKAEQTILEETGYGIKLKVKPFSTLQLDDSEEENQELVSTDILIDDKFACEKFIELMGEDIFVKGDTIWTYNPKTGLWSTGEIGLLIAVHKCSDALVFKQKDKNDDIKTFNYGGSTKNIKQMLTHLPALMNSRSCSENLSLKSSVGSLLFNDGWYDMDKKTFNEGFEECRNKFFTKRITRPFVRERNYKLEATIKKVLFQNPYNNPAIGEYYMNGIARAIAGKIEDKVWWSIVGKPNCGKGVMTSMIRNAFSEYVNSFNMNVLKYNNRDGTDEARKLAWYVPLIGSRISLGNEVRIDGRALDGNMMKTLSSGGDTLKLRKEHISEWEVDMITTFFGFCNSMPDVTPCDVGFKNRIRCIPHTKSFINKPQAKCNEYEMEADDSLKSTIDTSDWINSFFWIIMDAYGERLPAPQEVLDENDELFVLEDIKIKELLEERYEFVPTEKNDEDNNYETSRNVITYLQENGVRLSDTAIGRELKNLGLKKVSKKINKKCTLVYYGLKQ